MFRGKKNTCAYSINAPKVERNFRGVKKKNRVSLITTNQLLCAVPNKNVTDVLHFPFPVV